MIGFASEEGSNDKAIIFEFAVYDNKELAGFKLPDSQKLSATSRQDATGLGKSVKHFQPHPNEFPMLFGDVCPALVSQSN
jgi:hypothetical protein